MLAALIVMTVLAQDGGSVPPTCGTVLRPSRELEGDVELFELLPGRDASRRRTLELVDGGFCAPLEPGHWLARASGVAIEGPDPLSNPSWSATSRFTVPTVSPLQLTVAREAKRTFVVKDTWGRAVTGKLAVFDATSDLTTLVWSATLDAQGRAQAELLPDGDIEVRINHGQPLALHVERRTLRPDDATVTVIVQRPRAVSFRAQAANGSPLDAVQVDGTPATCISGLCRLAVPPSSSSVVVGDGRGAAALVQLPARPADLMLPLVKLSASQEAMVKLVGKDGIALDAMIDVQPVTMPGRWLAARGLVTLPAGEREVLVRPSQRQGGAFPQTKLSVRKGIIELVLPAAGFLKLEGPKQAELWVHPANAKLPAFRFEAQANAVGPLLAGRYTIGGWSRGLPLAPTDLEVEAGVTARLTLKTGPVATLVVRNERHDSQHPTALIVLRGEAGKLPEGLAEVRAVSSAFGLGSQAGLATLKAEPGPVTIVALWQREHQPIRVVSMQAVLTEGANEVRLDDTLRQQNLGPITEVMSDLLARPFDTTVDP